MTTIPPANAPSLLTEIHTVDIPAMYQRFSDVVGARSWTHRVAQMKAEIKHNHFLDAYLNRENEIAFGLDRCGVLIKRYGGLPDDVVANRELYPAISFAAQSLSMMDLATPVESERLRKRVAGALQNPNDMRALRLELTVATHFGTARPPSAMARDGRRWHLRPPGDRHGERWCRSRVQVDFR